MKRHFIGIALFVTIITGSVCLHGVLAVSSSDSFVAVREKQKPKVLESKIEKIVLDSDTNLITAKINLKWKGKTPPPYSLNFSYHFFNEENPQILPTSFNTNLYPVWDGNETTIKVNEICSFCANKENLRDIYLTFNVSVLSHYVLSDIETNRYHTVYSEFKDPFIIFTESLR